MNSSVRDGISGSSSRVFSPVMLRSKQRSHQEQLCFTANYGSPSLLGSPSQFENFLKRSTWSNVKGHIGEMIGRGGFGCVYKGKMHRVDVAIKKMLTTTTKMSVLSSLQSEKLAKGLRHPNIVTVYYINDRCIPYFVVMEYVRGPNLQYLIDNDDIKSGHVCGISQDIVAALEFIHGLRIAHLDLKPSNVLITSTGVAKLGDFGCAKRIQWNDDVDGGNERYDTTGTVAYRAPELFRGSSPSCKADIYSFGVLLWQMLTGKHPYHGKDKHAVIFSVVSQGLRPSLRDVHNESMINLCQCCWAGNPNSRPDAVDINQFLSSITTNSTSPVAKRLFGC